MSDDILYRPYTGESDLAHIMALVQSELSEPYVIYTFRYFLHQWCVALFVSRFLSLTVRVRFCCSHLFGLFLRFLVIRIGVGAGVDIDRPFDQAASIFSSKLSTRDSRNRALINPLGILKRASGIRACGSYRVQAEHTQGSCEQRVYRDA